MLKVFIYLMIYELKNSSTFQQVQENTDKIWKFQRYRLVFEYTDSSIFPPPLTFISYIISIINYVRKKKFSKFKGVKIESIKMFFFVGILWSGKYYSRIY